MSHKRKFQLTQSFKVVEYWEFEATSKEEVMEMWEDDADAYGDLKHVWDSDADIEVKDLEKIEIEKESHKLITE